jgi:predicted RNase H-like nuclease (RuvC/YqgF family)
MSQELSFAQALNEAKQIIVQQAQRIKSDAEKMKVQQDMLMSQGATISEQEKQLAQHVAEIDRMAGEISSLTAKLSEAVIAKDQADNIINRQGEKITSLQGMTNDLQRKVSEQSEKIHSLWREREGLMEKLPTKEDAEALSAMSALLMKKVTKGESQSRQMPQMRLAEAA